MLIDIFILVLCAMGTIASATNATRATSVGGMLFWDFAGGFELIATILQVMKIFCLTFPINYAIIYT